MKIQKKAFKRVLGVLALWGVLHIGIIIIDGLWDTSQKADVAIVLGSKVNENGELSERLRARVMAGLSAYKEGQVSRLLVSGGLGKEGHNEALVMKQFLMEEGVPEQHILTDSAGNTTALTAQNSQTIMQDKGLSSAIIVSHYFHVTRAKLACRQSGIKLVGSRHAKMPPQWRELYSIPREVLAYYVYLIRGMK
ncbi:MAG: YdcF family protein [Bacteroidota bacterium]